MPSSLDVPAADEDQRACSVKGCARWYHRGWDRFGEPPPGWLRATAGLPVRLCPAHAAPTWAGHWPTRTVEDQEPRHARPPVVMMRMRCECRADLGAHSTLSAAGEALAGHLAEVA